MKRKDFLRKMKDRRRGGTLEERQPEKRRKVDWRTLRIDLPASDEKLPAAELIPVGTLHRLPTGIRLEASSICWVRLASSSGRGRTSGYWWSARGGRTKTPTGS